MTLVLTRRSQKQLRRESQIPRSRSRDQSLQTLRSPQLRFEVVVTAAGHGIMVHDRARRATGGSGDSRAHRVSARSGATRNQFGIGARGTDSRTRAGAYDPSVENK